MPERGETSPGEGEPEPDSPHVGPPPEGEDLPGEIDRATASTSSRAPPSGSAREAQDEAFLAVVGRHRWGIRATVAASSAGWNFSRTVTMGRVADLESAGKIVVVEASGIRRICLPDREGEIRRHPTQDELIERLRIVVGEHPGGILLRKVKNLTGWSLDLFPARITYLLDQAISAGIVRCERRGMDPLLFPGSAEEEQASVQVPTIAHRKKSKFTRMVEVVSRHPRGILVAAAAAAADWRCSPEIWSAWAQEMVQAGLVLDAETPRGQLLLPVQKETAPEAPEEEPVGEVDPQPSSGRASPDRLDALERLEAQLSSRRREVFEAMASRIRELEQALASSQDDCFRRTRELSESQGRIEALERRIAALEAEAEEDREVEEIASEVRRLQESLDSLSRRRSERLPPRA